MALRSVRHDIYEPLCGDAIRLLFVKPGFKDESIECALVTVANLAESPPYNALSYVWGERDGAASIICNGADMAITKRLAEILKHLRRYPGWRSVVPWSTNHPLHSSKNAWNGFARSRHEQHQERECEHESLLWIDAICIDQTNDDERASQVKMMGKIYTRAAAVTIWLGAEAKQLPDSIPTSTILSSIHIGTHGPVPVLLSFIAQALRNSRGPQNILASVTPVEDSLHRNIAYGFPHHKTPEWEIVRDFFTNPWFERVWVVQEAVLASKATVLIGDWEIDWAAIGEAAIWFQTKGYALPAVLKYELQDQQDLLPVAKAVSVWNQCSSPDKQIPLLDLLQTFRNRLATNPRDKVYATFGIAKELAHVEEHGFHQLLEPDYEKPILDVYRDVARFLIIEHGSLAVLSHAGSPLEPSWPSWVPDWRQIKASNTLSTMPSANNYNASGSESLYMSFSEHADTLSLDGIDVDYVTAYGHQLASNGFGYVTYQEEVDFVNMAWGLVQPSETSSASDADRTVIKKIIQTLTAGQNTDPGFFGHALHWFAQHTHILPIASLLQRMPRSSRQRADSGRFHEAFVRACVDRRFFVTQNGLMGIGPDAMKEGDTIAILFGGRVPYLLKAVSRRYKVVGECYISELMDGEAILTWKDQGSRRKVFDLF
ncbi:hypothetical protein T440DRAFT_473471 [Plenodomus tracheiphilus IPT5]|uniref:Heterokaryon incompatibility domain-containing protein n=1 Tax=Plenodomus tracheiphilus IPT5 TaxID=1408161 RepID=A0A6A7AMD8_9PLEO|nr:hypothetical protein T440DRAFT_473471 [Plenodomus tracheiphilus IPT5]